MSTQSQTDFEWSVKIISDDDFCVGIASELRRELQREDSYIDKYDKNAITYWGCEGDVWGIYRGSATVHSDLKEHESGDVIRFRFQPKRKKLLIYLVSF